MHHLIIGEGQIGSAIVERAIADGDTVTILRRSDVAPAATRARYAAGAAHVHRVRGDVLDPDALDTAIATADAVHACFHAPYDARVWELDLPPREVAVLDAAATRGIPVIFPESMYAWASQASHLHEGDTFAPADAKGRIRVRLLQARAAHPARTVSIVASDLIGPTGVGTGTTIASALVVEPLVAGRRPFVPADPAMPHSLTYIPDLAGAMLHAARRPADLTGEAADAIVHAPTDRPRALAELAEHTSGLLGLPPRRMLSIPRTAVRIAGTVSRLMYEIAGLADMWYGPCRLEPGRLGAPDFVPTPWQDAVAATVAAARQAQQEQSAPSATV